MKRDLDRLMQQRTLDAIMVNGSSYGNPALYYMVNGAKLGRAHIIKRRNAPPVVIAYPMEREEALVSGLTVILSTRYDYHRLLKAHQGDALAATAAYYRRMLEDQGIMGGHVGFYGLQEQGEAYTLLQTLAAAMPALEIVGEFGDNLLQAARATKSPEEVARIREVGRRTIAVMRGTVAFLQSHAVGSDELLYQADGVPLTVGDVHAHIRRLLAQEGLEDPEGFIFATGRDAGIPHNRGAHDAPLRLGESIVCDIFPREAGGGYFFDMTRTFCLGYAPEAVAQLHADTLACMNQVYAALAVGEPLRRYQPLACASFRERGHLTIADNPAALSGYVHGLGHGVGLDVHESPSFSDAPDNIGNLEPGHVFTVEPGLYYPERGMGCRLEDTVWLDEAGQLHNLTPYPYDLIIPMR